MESAVDMSRQHRRSRRQPATGEAAGISRWREGSLVLLGFAVLGALLYHTPLFTHPAGLAAGLGLRDNDSFVWYLGWPAHAILHGLDPLYSHIVFVPAGYNLTRTTPMLDYGVVLAPLTWLAGPMVTYNVAMLSLPALNGSVAYALCRRIGATRPAATMGGFVFATAGVVSYSELGAPTAGTGLFVALALLLAIDLTDGRRPRRTAALLGLDLLGQLYFAAEQLALMILFGALLLAVTWALDHERRATIRRLPEPAAITAAILCIGGLPYFLTYGLGGGPVLLHANPNLYPSDLLAFVAPSALQWLGHGHFTTLAATFPESPPAYVGIGLVAIMIWYVVGRWREAVSIRIFGVVMAAIVICSLGTHLTIAGHQTIALPWALVTHLPLLRYALPSHVTLFTALAVALGLALWLSSSTGRLKWFVAVAACALLIPNPDVLWATSLHVPAFFSSGAAARELAGERVMALPYAGPDDADQAEAGYAFSLAGGYFGQYPNSYGDYIGATYLIDRESPPGAPAAVAQLVHAKRIQAVVVDASAPGPWHQLLSGLGVTPVSRDGVLVYYLRKAGQSVAPPRPAVSSHPVTGPQSTGKRCRRRRPIRGAVSAALAASALAACGSSSSTSHASSTPAARTSSTPAVQTTSTGESTPTSSSAGVSISASPNPVPAGASRVGTTVIHWTAPAGKTVVIRVSANGSAPKVFAAARASGSASAAFIVAPNSYVFTVSIGSRVFGSVRVTRA